MRNNGDALLEKIAWVGAVFLVFVMPWMAGAQANSDDLSHYRELSGLDFIGMIIGDWLRGFGELFNMARDGLADWLGF